MATSISAAHMLPDMDYSISHRSPPPIPPSHLHHSKRPSSPENDYHFYHNNAGGAYSANIDQQLHQQQPAHHSHSSSVASERTPRRQTSITAFLRRSSSRQRRPSEPILPTDIDVQPLPAQARALIAQAQAEAIANRNLEVDNAAGATGAAATTETTAVATEGEDGSRKMQLLRKTSAMRRERALERQAQEAEREARRQQPAPQIHQPPLSSSASAPFHAIDGEDIRAYTYSNPHYPFTAAGNNNYPHDADVDASNFAFATSTTAMDPASSSPAYAVRSAHVLPTDSSSPDIVRAKASRQYDAEYVPIDTRRADSMTNRSRYSLGGSSNGVDVNSPRRIRRRRDPTPFNILVVGAKNSGKTSFITFLRHSLALPTSKTPPPPPPQPAPAESTMIGGKAYTYKPPFTPHYVEADLEGERVGLTLWDSPGLEKHIIDLQLREMGSFVESKFEETFIEEQKVMRSPGVQDSHIHCVLLVLDPLRLDATIAAADATGPPVGSAIGDFAAATAAAGPKGLDEELDLQVLRALWGKTTVIPVIAKADTLTCRHAAFLKRAVWDSMKAAGLDPLEALELEDDMDDLPNSDNDEDDNKEDEILDDGNDEDNDSPFKKPKASRSAATLTQQSHETEPETPYIPMTILSPDPLDHPFLHPTNNALTTPSPTQTWGRHYPWGTADPNNPSHSDFPRLRASVFGEWRGELRDLARSRWYENWRTTRLEKFPAAAMRKQRVRGGVTPVASVPAQGRSGSGTAAVPRSAGGVPGGGSGFGAGAGLQQSLSQQSGRGLGAATRS